MDLFLTIVVIIFCLAVEVFYSGSEIALVVADKIKLKALAESGNRGAKAAMWFVRHPAHFFSTVILGTNIAVVAASTVATFYLIANYGENAEGWALLLSPVVLVFGEVLPKSLFQHYADRLTRKVSSPLIVSMYAIYPLVWILSKMTNTLLGGVAHHVGSEPRITREELALMITSQESSDVPVSERKMISRILNLANERVENIMVPLALVESVPVNITKDGALQVFDLKGFSKLPVFENRAYNIIGTIDCLDCLFSESESVREYINPVMYVPKGMHLHELYLVMRDKNEQMAVVVDEYGAACGLITLEDVLEEIVGEIKDEYELGRQHWRVISQDHIIVSGITEIEEINERFVLDIPKGRYETLAGFLLDKFGYIPKEGESTEDGRWNYTVRKASEKAIIEVEVKKK